MTRPVLIAAAVLLSFLAAAPPGHAAWRWPLRGEVITPYRNGDDPYAGGQHRGIDIAGELGSSVVAATAGEVRFAGIAGVSGLTVSLRTDDGRYDTSYLHLSAVSVRKGDAVAAGDALGAVGTTGSRSAVAPHLHFGVRDAGSSAAYHDPLGFLPPLATTGQPQPGTPAPAPETVPGVPSPQPIPQPVANGRRAPQPSRAPGATPGRVRSGAPARGHVRSGAPVPGRVRSGAPVRGHLRAGAPASGRIRGEARDGAGARGRAGVPANAGGGVHARTTQAAPGRALSLSGAHPASASAGPARRGAAHGVGRQSSMAAGGRASAVRHAGLRSRSAAHAPGDAGYDRRSAAERAASRQGGDSQSRRPRDAGGANAGWALACLGLLLAAALVGSSGGARDFVRRRGSAAGRTLRPLLGRG